MGNDKRIKRMYRSIEKRLNLGIIKKNDSMIKKKNLKKIKKVIFPGATLIVSLYISILFFIGVLIGYWGTNKFLGKFIETGKINPVYFNFGKWELHFHHWLMGIAILLSFWIFGFYSLMPKIIIGAVGGVVAHDLYTDKKWHKVLYKK